MKHRTLKEVLIDHHISSLSETERNVIKWQHLRASVAYPRYFIERYAKWTFPIFVTSIGGGLILLLIAGALTVLFTHVAFAVAICGLIMLILGALILAIFVVVDELCHDRPAYWNQTLDHTKPTDRANIPEIVVKQIDALTHPMGSGVEVSIEGSSTMFRDCILVHYTCWVSKNKPLQIEAIASWEITYKIPHE